MSCNMCGYDTDIIVNINMKPVSICNSCCYAVTKQTMMWLINEEIPRLKKIENALQNKPCMKDSGGKA